MKPVSFLSRSLAAIRAFPDGARRAAGYQIERLQRGLDPDDWKPMKTIGPGVREIRLRDSTGVFRVIYLASLADAVYVLHAFQKKSQATSKADREIARRQFRQLMETIRR